MDEQTSEYGDRILINYRFGDQIIIRDDWDAVHFAGPFRFQVSHDDEQCDNHEGFTTFAKAHYALFELLDRTFPRGWYQSNVSASKVDVEIIFEGRREHGGEGEEIHDDWESEPYILPVIEDMSSLRLKICHKPGAFWYAEPWQYIAMLIETGDLASETR